MAKVVATGTRTDPDLLKRMDDRRWRWTFETCSTAQRPRIATSSRVLAVVTAYPIEEE
jgi:hypothetical protein